MKKIAVICLSFLLVLGMFPSMALAADKVATPTGSQVLVDGKTVAFDAYTIDGNNYFKLRDLAFALNGSGKQFEVTWDGSKSAINLIPKTAYTTTDKTLPKGDGLAKTATLSTATTYVSGNVAPLAAYTINGSNYFKLRDLMQTIDVYVGWDGAKNVITLETVKGYGASEPAKEPVKEPASKVITVPVTIENKVGVDIYGLALSPANDGDWGENILLQPLLADEACISDVDFTADTLVWDLLVVDGEKNQLTFMGIDFSKANVSGATLVLSIENGQYVAKFI